MAKRKKLWVSMQAIGFASLTLLSACEKGEKVADLEGHENAESKASPSSISVDMAMGEGEGEGEGNSSAIDLATNDHAYLSQLSLMRGHLLVGYELYQAGHMEHAKTHMKHPESELYADIEPAFARRGATGFAEELTELAKLVESEQDQQSVADAYASLSAAITASEAVVDATNHSAAAKLKLAMALLRVAGEEYAIAVVDGKMENAHEYQDAYGFTQVAKSAIASITTSDENTAAAVAKADKIVADLAPLWPNIIPPTTLDTKASQLYGAAAQVELLALGLE